MPEVHNGNVYDMAAMSLKENASKRIAEFTRENLFVGIPALVTSTDDYEQYQCLAVQPVIDGVYVKHDNIVLESNILTRVFVLLPSTGGFSIKQPVDKGDIVTLYWAHKDLGEWLDSDGSERVQQSIFKIANIEDCWCELRGGTRKNHTNPSLENLVIEGPNTTITITPSGELTVDTDGSVDVTCADYTVNCDTYTVECDTFGVECTDFNVNSDTFTHNDTNVGDTHVHGGVVAGSSNTSTPS